MPVLTIDLPEELERRLREAAAARGQAAADYARAALETRVAADHAERNRQARIKRNQGAVALLDLWLAEAAQREPTGEDLVITPSRCGNYGLADRVERIALDATPLGLLCHPDRANATTLEIMQWLWGHLAEGVTVYLPEIADYEVRRELLLQGNANSVALLNQLAGELVYLPLDTGVMRRAAEFWAEVRRQHRPTTGAAALDGDVILAAQAASVDATVATDNVRHLALFVEARPWREIR